MAINSSLSLPESLGTPVPLRLRHVSSLTAARAVFRTPPRSHDPELDWLRSQNLAACHYAWLDEAEFGLRVGRVFLLAPPIRFAAPAPGPPKIARHHDWLDVRFEP